MNTLKSFIFLMALFSFIGCSNDDDAGGGISASLVGTWNATDFDLNGDASTEINGTPFTVPIITDVTNNGLTVTFEENPNNFSSTGSIDIDASVSVVGMTYDQSIDNFDPIGSGTYTINGNEIVFTSTEGSTDVTIQRLNETTLILDLTNVVESNQDGQEITATFNSIVTFERQ